jgi:hypothetical protein
MARSVSSEMKFFRNRPAGIERGRRFHSAFLPRFSALLRGENQIIPCQHPHLLYLDADFTEGLHAGCRIVLVILEAILCTIQAEYADNAEDSIAANNTASKNDMRCDIDMTSPTNK